MITEFLNYLKHERRLSENSIKSYQNDLSQFEKYISAKGESQLIHSSSSHIKEWLSLLIKNQNPPTTINRKLSSLRSFYKFLIKKKVISSDPSLGINSLKVPKKIPNYIPQGDIKEFIESRGPGDEFKHVRNFTIFDLFYGTGIRLNELILLDHSDIDFSNQQIKVRGKGNKERIIPIPTQTLDILNIYIKLKDQHFSTTSSLDDPLFVTDSHRRCYPMFIQRLIKKFLEFFPDLSKRSPHVIRHTYATHLLNRGAELMSIKELLGHSSLKSTQVYTHLSIEKLKKSYKSAHPRSKK